MKKTRIFAFAILFLGAGAAYSQEAADSSAGGNRRSLFFMPAFSYSFVSFDNFRYHNPRGGLTVMRRSSAGEGAAGQGDIFTASLSYAPQIAEEIHPDFPDLYHRISLSIARKTGRHTAHGVVAGMTDKPFYGGSRTFMGMAGYSYNLIDGPHFSMDLGAMLLVMDINLTLNNGTPWLFWPLPSLSLSWEYEWLAFSARVPEARLEFAPQFPVSLVARAGPQGLDAAVWYRRYKAGNRRFELFGAAAGIKKEKAAVMVSDGGRYGIDYWALYGTVRAFGFLEFSGGRAFNGKAGYRKMDWASLFESFGYSKKAEYEADPGDGYFASVSLRLMF